MDFAQMTEADMPLCQAIGFLGGLWATRYHRPADETIARTRAGGITTGGRPPANVAIAGMPEHQPRVRRATAADESITPHPGRAQHRAANRTIPRGTDR
jgi:hypothetical protein